MREWLCTRCGDIIGVYERAIVVEEGDPRETSKLSEPDFADATGELYHADCWALADCGEAD